MAELQFLTRVEGVVDVDASVQRLEIDFDSVVVEDVVCMAIANRRAVSECSSPGAEASGRTLVPLAHPELDRSVDLGQRQIDLFPLLGRPPSAPLFHGIECTLADRARCLPGFEQPRLHLARNTLLDGEA